ncbi:MAG: bifunctional demethylmenaquinone methyltransferase/2-methoxy-6-polyprenyl-1,4-benzoquinol methylase UbiE [Acidobacteriaceae bacterium]|nr:bifunctional demethylmenaquinone methyltransferase/2-methoxy-6-polyprenyl-1,4-benzoquinol methylase UbiE [Acidobacteriaceae bacterium]
MQMVAGTTPPGTSSEQQAARWVQRMFAGIAPRYDFLNHLLSFNIDRSWRRVLMRRLAPVLQKPDARILDLCCGTGDVLLDLQEIAATPVMGADFCHPMLVSAQQKASSRGFRAPLFEADALELPLAAGSLDAITISFGFRNLANYAAGLRELHRVLKPGAPLAILEFSHPPGLITKAGYGIYSRVLLPAVGTLVSGSWQAYAYLPDSIRKFPTAEELRRMMNDAGFEDARYELLTGGIAALHLGAKSA